MIVDGACVYGISQQAVKAGYRVMMIVDGACVYSISQQGL